MESVSTPNTTSNESNTNTTSNNNNNNEKGDLNSHAIYENGEFQLIEHLLHQQEIDKEDTKINLTNKAPLTNENDTEIVLVREEEQQQQQASQFQASTLPPRFNQQNQPIINQTKIRTTTSTDYTKHAMNSSLPFASFQPGQASNILQQRNENFLKNSTNIITNLSPMANHRPLPQVPTKPRTIITLPHLRNRNQNQQTQQHQQQQSLSQNSSQITNQTSSNKTPIIIRERIEPPTLSISTPTTVNITSVSSSSSSNIVTSPINSNKNENSNQMNRVSSSSSPSTNSSSTNQIYSTSSSSNSSSPASSTSSQNSVPITIASRQTKISQVNFNPVVSPTLTNKASNNKSDGMITSNETAINNANNMANIEYSPLKSSLQNKIIMNAATFSPSNNFTYEINSSKLNPIISTLSGSNDKNNIYNTRDTSMTQNNTESGAFMSIENRYVRVNSSPKSTIGVF